jgi:hypothetical protein
LFGHGGQSEQKRLACGAGKYDDYIKARQSYNAAEASQPVIAAAFYRFTLALSL